ncbi:3-deoxy-D-manno-octulosonic acid transferase [Seohaeicola zhoushanensis]
MNDLARRLRMMRPGIAILHTHVPSARPEDAPLPGGADWVMPLDSDHPASARQFVGHWRPDFCLWAGGILMPNVIAAAAEIGVPLCIADLGSAELQSSRHKWLPDLTRSSLDMFTWILASNQTTQRNLRRLGIAAEKITVAPRLRGNVLPPGCNDDDLESVTQDLAARQVWLAAHVRPSEFAAVLAAHRSALRLVHRLLLVISLTDRSSAETLKSALGLARLRYADWDEGDAIEDGVQVVISDDPADLGLWYRIAPLTFLASSLGEGARGSTRWRPRHSARRCSTGPTWPTMPRPMPASPPPERRAPWPMATASARRWCSWSPPITPPPWRWPDGRSRPRAQTSSTC